MRNISRSLVVIIIFICFSSSAQDQPPIKIVAEDPGVQGETCGVSKLRILSVASEVLQANRLSVKEDGVILPYLYVQSGIQVLSDRSNCIYALNVSIRNRIKSDSIGRIKSREFLTSALLCNNASLGLVARKSGSEKIYAVLREQIKSCLQELDFQ